jgi:plastocyanin
LLRTATPGRPRSGRLGVLCFVLLAAACNGVQDGGETVVLDSAEVSVDGAVHEVRITGVGATDTLAPPRLDAEVGDVVRFVVADRRPHALAFIADSLAPQIRDYLDRTGQLRGPPLVSEGSTWVVALEDAPPGQYPFYCRSHDVYGVLRVTAPE